MYIKKLRTQEKHDMYIYFMSLCEMDVRMVITF